MIKLRFLLLTILILSACANRGTPTGGEIDTDPPVVLNSSPENYTTNFKDEEIEITKKYIVYIADAQEQIVGQYEDMFSVIKSPSKKLIV